MKCSECKKECKQPIEAVDLGFNYGTGRTGLADWDDGKVYCCLECMFTALMREGKQSGMPWSRKEIKP